MKYGFNCNFLKFFDFLIDLLRSAPDGPQIHRKRSTFRLPRNPQPTLATQTRNK